MADLFPIHPTYTGISVAYRNEEMIADKVLPEGTPVSTKEFRYNVWPPEEMATVPDTRMGRRSEANTIEVTATETAAKVNDYALSDLVPNDDITNASQGYDPMAHATEVTTDLMILAREVRASNIVFNAATYLAGQKTALAGVTQWSDFVNSDPFQAIWSALDIPLMRPNLVVLGQPVWNQVAIHPKVISKLYGSGSQLGKARLGDLAEALEVEEIVIGKARVNTAKKGQAASLQRAWGKGCALIYRNKLANNQRGMTFGQTFRKSQRVTRVIDEPKVGVGGSQRVQVEEQLLEAITAASCGYYFDTAVA